MSKSDFRRLDMRIAYPWPVDVDMPQDVSEMGLDEAIYGVTQMPQPDTEEQK